MVEVFSLSNTQENYEYVKTILVYYCIILCHTILYSNNIILLSIICIPVILNSCRLWPFRASQNGEELEFDTHWIKYHVTVILFFFNYYYFTTIIC